MLKDKLFKNNIIKTSTLNTRALADSALADSAPIIKSKIALGSTTANVGTLFINNGKNFANKPAFAQRINGQYHYWNWQQLTQDIYKLASYLLTLGLALNSNASATNDDSSNARIAFVAGNNYQRLVCEMAVMSCGFISVPIFAGYPSDTMAKLIEFSQVDLLITDLPQKIANLNAKVIPANLLILNDNEQHGLERLASCECFDNILAADHLSALQVDKIKDVFIGVAPKQLALIMYTSGTSGFPKGVQLSHENLMSQQQALVELWQPQPNMRFLCYLPWHHSFGGLFERFFALHSGGCLAIDDSCGKNVDQLLRNFAEIKPHVYFSVPKIYQEIVARVLSDAQVEKDFFHSELKFVFTAAAPLPMSTSDVFSNQGVPVVEGWGLTETSPCCTLTSYVGDSADLEQAANLNRVAGVVGDPIPGVELTMGDENEILVRGKNVMSGYFNNPIATAKAFTPEGWFKTGDIGEFTPDGVKIISRKERMFKLDNGEKIFPAQIEDSVNSHCKFIKYAFVFGAGERHPFIIMFPNSDLFSASLAQNSADHGCVNPKNASCLAKCLRKCIKEINDARPAGFEQIERALIINRELTLEANELTPSFKLIPSKIEQHYQEYISKVQQQNYDDLPADAYVVPLNVKSCEQV
jgi:long-subunit acyl-CoA synthetase (AMP-forming)